DPPVIGRCLLGGVIVVALCEALHRARRRAAQSGEALAASEAQFRATLTSIGDAVIVTDLDGRLTFLNPAAEALTGWPFDAALGEPLDSVFRTVDEDTRRPAGSPVARVLQTGAAVRLDDRTLLIARDGTERPV